MVTNKLLLKYHPDLRIILVAVLYYISARLGYFLAFHDSTALPTWPPSGIAFALIILLGRSTWPGITIGALVSNLMAYWNSESLPPQTIITISTFIAMGHTLEAVLGNFLIKKWIKDDYPFMHARNAFRFLFVTLLMCAVGAGIGSLSLWANGVISLKDYLQTGFSWWVCNVVGILLFTPFILACARRQNISFNLGKSIEIVIFILSIGGIFFLLQLDDLGETMERALPFLCLPFLLWLAFRFDLIVAIACVVVASLFSIYLTVLNVGPFTLPTSSDSMLLLQIFIGVISISTIILSATVKERVVAQKELQLFTANLEGMVEERTKK
jgi:integral membrane sensor domain MASE1